MKKLELIYEGKAKKIFTTDITEQLIVEFKDDATAFNGQKKGEINKKGVLNNEISIIFFDLLAKHQIPHHQIKRISAKEVLVEKLEIIPVEVVMRNKVAGSLAERIGLKEGTMLKKPILEFYYKNDELGDPMINQFHIDSLELATVDELEEMSWLAFQINEILYDFLQEKEIDLIDFKLEFGKNKAGKVILGDEISPDTCRFWDLETGEKLDKDRFRRDLGNVTAAYQEILKRIQDGDNK